MEQTIDNLSPKAVWYFFKEVLAIPRPSGKTEAIQNWLIGFAKERNLEFSHDEAGNVLIKKPATAGKENCSTIILQSHMDMVCEKNSDVVHDFEKDPIEAYIDGEWLKAKGTTLGADNGIGVATQLALLDAKDLVHGHLEC